MNGLPRFNPGFPDRPGMLPFTYDRSPSNGHSGQPGQLPGSNPGSLEASFLLTVFRIRPSDQRNWEIFAPGANRQAR